MESRAVGFFIKWWKPGKGSSGSSSVYWHFEQVNISFLKRKKSVIAFILLRVQNLKIIHHLLTKIPNHSEIVPVMPWRIPGSDQGLGECGGSLSKSKEYCVFQRWTRWECFTSFVFPLCWATDSIRDLFLLGNLRIVGQIIFLFVFQKWAFIECNRNWCCMVPLKITAKNYSAHFIECMYMHIWILSAFHCRKGALGGGSGGWKWECFVFLIFHMAFVILMWD